MKLTEHKNDVEHYYRDEKYNLQGFVKMMQGTDLVIGHAQDGKKFGEIISFDTITCKITQHDYHVRDDRLDLLAHPVTDPEEKMLIKLKYGGEWINEDLDIYRIIFAKKAKDEIN